MGYAMGMPNEEEIRKSDRKIAYFSMEFGLQDDMPTYSGGLGMLAGDTVRSAADMKIPLVAMTLLHRRGYFTQILDSDGRQDETPSDWAVSRYLEEEKPRVTVVIEGRNVYLRAWRYDVAGRSGYGVPVYMLDADLPENGEEDRRLTDFLYGGGEDYRLRQEIILGIGGARMLRALGYDRIERFHMNEGHSAFLTLELLQEHAARDGRTRVAPEDIEKTREQCIFTTHTPVPAGHDVFPMDLVRRVLAPQRIDEVEQVLAPNGQLNMTRLALNLSHYVNGVAKKHGEVSRNMFASFSVDSITNGVHAVTWTSKPFQDLYDRYVQGWREDNFSLRYALGIPPSEVWRAHLAAKSRLIEYVNRTTDARFRLDDFTLGFARRAAPYKRADLVLQDVDRLMHVARHAGPIQIVFAGKAHPRDELGKELIRRVFDAAKALDDGVRVAYLTNYGMRLGGMLTAGVDAWLNTPQPPLEASGTSGMKAALNGVPSFSVLDGWWVEGWIEGVTGWAIGGQASDSLSPEERRVEDARSLYEKLEYSVLPTFYQHVDRYIDVMRHAIALNGSFFNTQRMMMEYVTRAYFV